MSTQSAPAVTVDKALSSSSEYDGFQAGGRKKKRSANGGPPAKRPTQPANPPKRDLSVVIQNSVTIEGKYQANPSEDDSNGIIFFEDDFEEIKDYSNSDPELLNKSLFDAFNCPKGHLKLCNTQKQQYECISLYQFFKETLNEGTAEGNNLEAYKEIDEDIIYEKQPNDEELEYRVLESVFMCPSGTFYDNDQCLTLYQLMHKEDH
ncbi:unnamed protein product [Pieris macdunnoughi]|uniref:Uncharacterized protein n=1 Tax=Pieris macdunnoughi TaxID=345717 RepID=A0A821PAJ7_9NEOP|nr:unnamed protein product [Pieris macdunnoughi]